MRSSLARRDEQRVPDESVSDAVVQQPVPIDDARCAMVAVQVIGQHHTRTLFEGDLQDELVVVKLTWRQVHLPGHQMGVQQFALV